MNYPASGRGSGFRGYLAGELSGFRSRFQLLVIWPVYPASGPGSGRPVPAPAPALAGSGQLHPPGQPADGPSRSEGQGEASIEPSGGQIFEARERCGVCGDPYELEFDGSANDELMLCARPACSD